MAMRESGIKVDYILQYRELSPAALTIAIKRIENCSVEIYSKLDIEPVAVLTTNKISMKIYDNSLYDLIEKEYTDIKDFRRIVTVSKNLTEIYPDFKAKPIYRGDLLGSLVAILSLVTSPKYDTNDYFGIRVVTREVPAIPEEIIIIKRHDMIYFLMGLLDDKSLQDCLVIYKEFNEDKLTQIISSLLISDKTNSIENFIKGLPTDTYNTDKEVLESITKLWVTDES